MPKYTKAALDPRAALASAITDAETARSNLSDARSAASKAEEHVFTAQDRLAMLHEDSAKADRSDSFISTLASGADFDVMEIDRPAAVARARIEAQEQEIAAWRRARDTAEQAVPVRERAVAVATERVKAAVAAVVAEAFDVDQLLTETEAATTVLIERRAHLMALSRALPVGSADREAIAAFLSRDFLSALNGDGWRHLPTAAALTNWTEALAHNADAPAP